MRLAAIGLDLPEERNARLEGENGAIARIIFADGTALRRGAIGDIMANHSLIDAGVE